MHALTLEGIVGVYLVLLLDTGLVVQCLVSLDLGHHACDIGQDEKGLVLDLRGEPFVTLIGQVDAVHLLVNNEIEGLYCLGHTTVVVLHVDVLGTEESCLDAWLGEVFDEGLVLRQCLETAEEGEKTLGSQVLVVLLSTLAYQFLGLSKILCGKCALDAYKALYQRLVFLEHLVIALGNGT